MDLSGNDLDSVTRTILAEAGENATPASMAAVASVIRNRLTASGYGKTPLRSSMRPTSSSHGFLSQLFGAA
jgi:spore germination cell wall hydrolase CwlJ-like protein